MIKDLERRTAELVPDAPLSLIREKVRWAARELCTEADAWVSDEVPLVYGADTDYPTLAAPLGELVRIIYLVFHGRQERAGSWFTQIGTNQIQFHREIDQGEVCGRAALRPRLGQLPPSDVLSRWSEPIVAGAVSNLLMLPQAWRNPDMAMHYERIFRSGINDIKRNATLGYSGGRSRVRARRFI